MTFFQRRVMDGVFEESFEQSERVRETEAIHFQLFSCRSVEHEHYEFLLLFFVTLKDCDSAYSRRSCRVYQSVFSSRYRNFRWQFYFMSSVIELPNIVVRKLPLFSCFNWYLLKRSKTQIKKFALKESYPEITNFSQLMACIHLLNN